MTVLHIQLDSELLEVLQDIAQKQAVSIDDLVTMAVKAYLQPVSKTKRYSFIGIGHSGKGHLSTHVEDILAEAADRQEGWSLPK